MAELEQLTTNDCCSTEAQETCCEPTDKAACCVESATGESCGCSAGTSATDAEEIRKTVRARKPA
jgi:hypothetical protein